MTKLPTVIMYWAWRLVIPAVMILIAARAVYLNQNYNLSTWKGGGMGMFAAADNSYTRFSHVFIEGPDGRRYPLVRMPTKQMQLLRDALLYPVRESFVTLANEIRTTRWALSGSPEKVRQLDSRGNVIREGPEAYQILIPAGDRPSGEATDFAVIFENYQMRYDVSDSSLSAHRMNAYRFETME